MKGVTKETGAHKMQGSEPQTTKQHKSAEAGVLCTARLYLIQKLTQSSELTKAIKSTTLTPWKNRRHVHTIFCLFVSSLQYLS